MIGMLLERADTLIQQNRFAEAERIVGPILMEYPEDIEVHFMMARIRLGQNNVEDAKQFVGKAITIDPDNPTSFYLLSIIEFNQTNYRQSEELVRQSIQIMPTNAYYFAHLSHIKIVQKEFDEALGFAKQGLSIDPENLNCLNMKSMALNKLKRTEEAFQVIKNALSHHPDDTYTHANFGWELLEKGKYKQAQIHFGESLKNNPNNEYAKAGLVEAMKAGNPLYRIFLQYAFWMGNLKSKFQYAIIIGLYLLVNVLDRVAASYPKLAPFLLPIIIIYLIFALSSWMIVPISNLFLRLNHYGRYALSRKDIWISNITGGLLLVASIGLIGSLSLKLAGFTAIGIWAFSMIIPVSVFFRPVQPSKRKIIQFYALGLAMTGILAIVLVFLSGDLINSFAMIYLCGIILFQWAVNFLMD